MLYCQDERQDRLNVLASIDGFSEGLGISGLAIDADSLDSVIRNMRHDFPAQGGVEMASPFKKAANFLCWFVSLRPIQNPIPASKLGEDIATMPNHQNAVIGLHIAFDSLVDATIYRDDRKITLGNRIKLSAHSYTDTVQACCNLQPQSHFHIAQVLLEQMSYRANPDASYELVV